MPLGSFRLNGLAKKIASLVYKNRYDYNFVPTVGATISTTSSKYGGASMRLAATTDLLETTIPHTVIPDNSDWCVEGWVNLDNLGNFSGFRGLFGHTNFGGINIRQFGSNNGVIEYYIVDKNGANPVNWNGGTINPSSWTHWAVTHRADFFTIWINGVNVSSRGPYTSNYNIFGTSTVSNGLDIGGTFIGYSDEIRVSKVARYSVDFTPPPRAFVNDSATVLLYHMDGTNGTQAFIDDNSAFNTVSTVAHQATATSTASTITIPATAQAGDVAILFDNSTTVTDTIPTNWDSIAKVTTTGIRQNVSYKILASGEPGTTITGMAGTTRKVMLVYRPNVAASGVAPIVLGSQATTATPTAQSLVGEAGPVITFAVYSSTGAIATRGWSVGSPTEYSSVSTSAIYVKALITNSGTPSTTSITMSDGGTNALQSFRLKFL